LNLLQILKIGRADGKTFSQSISAGYQFSSLWSLLSAAARTIGRTILGFWRGLAGRPVRLRPARLAALTNGLWVKTASSGGENRIGLTLDIP